MALHNTHQNSRPGNNTYTEEILGNVAAATASAVVAAGDSGQVIKKVTSSAVFNVTGDAVNSGGAAVAPADGGSIGLGGGFVDFPSGYAYYDDQQFAMPPTPAHLLIICTILYVTIFVMGLIGNTAVILVVLQCRSVNWEIFCS